jgi:hypothetical protein
MAGEFILAHDARKMREMRGRTTCEKREAVEKSLQTLHLEAWQRKRTTRHSEQRPCSNRQVLAASLGLHKSTAK